MAAGNKQSLLAVNIIIADFWDGHRLLVLLPFPKSLCVVGVSRCEGEPVQKGALEFSQGKQEDKAQWQHSSRPAVPSCPHCSAKQNKSKRDAAAK